MRDWVQLVTGRGKGWGEDLQWREQENRVTGMLKKIDSEDLKMMQLLNHVVTTLEQIYMEGQIQSFNFWMQNEKKLSKA